MTLHREIFWVGRQWAVTGYGLQACDQKQKGKFDIEASRLWEDAALQSIRAEKWFNAEDFDKALAVARSRYPEPPRPAAPPQAGAFNEAATNKEARATEPMPKQLPVEESKPTVQRFNMRIDGWPAKFVSPWRIRIRR